MLSLPIMAQLRASRSEMVSPGAKPNGFGCMPVVDVGMTALCPISAPVRSAQSMTTQAVAILVRLATGRFFPALPDMRTFFVLESTTM